MLKMTVTCRISALHIFLGLSILVEYVSVRMVGYTTKIAGSVQMNENMNDVPNNINKSLFTFTDLEPSSSCGL